MKLTTVSLSAVGVSPWIPLDYRQNPFSVSLAVDLDSAASGITYEVQHTLDNLGKKVNPITITRSGTTVTVVYLTPHGLNVNDSIVVEGSGVTGMDGTFNVASVGSTTSLTYTSGTSGAATGNSDTSTVLLRVFPHEFLTGKTTSDDGNYGFPVMACRLSVSAHSAGSATLLVIQGTH
jgi:hypothetical protein